MSKELQASFNDLSDNMNARSFERFVDALIELSRIEHQARLERQARRPKRSVPAPAPKRQSEPVYDYAPIESCQCATCGMPPCSWCESGGAQ